MTRNPVARHIRKLGHHVVQDKRKKVDARVAVQEAMLNSLAEFDKYTPEEIGLGRFDPTKSDGTNYD